MNFYRNIKDKLSKRERILLFILMILIFELIFIRVFIVENYKKLEKLNIEDKELTMEINNNKKYIKKLKLEKNEKIDPKADFKLAKTYEEKTFYENIEKIFFIENFFNKEDNVFTFKIDNDNLKNLKNISNNYNLSNIQISKNDENTYTGEIKFLFKEPIIKINPVDKKEKINLEKYTKYQKVKNTYKLDEKTDKKTTLKSKETVEKNVKTNENVDSISDLEKRVVKESLDEKVIKKEEKSSENIKENSLKKLWYYNISEKEISLNLPNEVQGSINYIENLDIYSIYINKKDDDLLPVIVEFNEKYNVKNLIFEVFLQDVDVLSEVGVCNLENIQYEGILNKEDWNRIDFGDIENLGGIYFLIEKEGEYVFLIRNIDMSYEKGIYFD